MAPLVALTPAAGLSDANCCPRWGACPPLASCATPGPARAKPHPLAVMRPERTRSAQYLAIWTCLCS